MSRVTEVESFIDLTRHITPEAGSFCDSEMEGIVTPEHLAGWMDELDADVRMYEWTLVAEEEPYHRWRTENKPSTYWKFEGKSGDAKARIQYWRCEAQGDDILIILTQHNCWIVASLCGHPEISSNKISFQNSDGSSDLLVHSLPTPLTVETLLRINRVASHQVLFNQIH